MPDLICVCGAGTMGSGIAETAALHGIGVILYDLDAAALARAAKQIRADLDQLAARDKLGGTGAKQVFEKIRLTTDLNECRAGIIVEAIIEEAGAKAALFTGLEKINGSGTLFASNSSSLSISSIAGQTAFPERIAGMHFFNPAPRMKLVEIVRTAQLSESGLGRIRELAIRMGKTPVVCADSPGFIVNHVARPFYLEALRLLEQGVADAGTIDRLTEAAGFRMGPFHLMDLIGNDINLTVSRSLYKSLGMPARLKPSALQEEKVQQGHLGRKQAADFLNTAGNPRIFHFSNAPSIMIFLTGGTGFLGSYLLTGLVQRGYRVRALRRDNARPFYLSPEVAEQVDWVQGDILDVVCLDEYLKGCNRIIHAAGLVSFDPADRKKLWKVNIEGTANLVNAAVENQISDYIHISSVGALGKTNGGAMLTEEKKWTGNNQESPYAISKYHAEMEVWRGMGEGLNPLIINPSTILGYGNWNRGSCVLFRNGYQEFPWYSQGANGFVDVEDLARAVLLLMESPVRNERFIVSAENWSYRRLFDAIADGFGKKHPAREATPFLAGLAWRAEKLKSLVSGKNPLITRETAVLAQKKTAYDNSKLLSALPGFHFTPLDDSIRNACARYLENRQPVGPHP